MVEGVGGAQLNKKKKSFDICEPREATCFLPHLQNLRLRLLRRGGEEPYQLLPLQSGPYVYSLGFFLD